MCSMYASKSLLVYLHTQLDLQEQAFSYQARSCLGLFSSSVLNKQVSLSCPYNLYRVTTFFLQLCWVVVADSGCVCLS